MSLTTSKLKNPTRPSFPGADTVVGTMYSIHGPGRTIPLGWTGRNKDGQWLLWNAHGDFWYSYAATKGEAIGRLC